MVETPPVPLLLAGAALTVAVSTVPFSLTAIDYRRRDNGLAYLLLVAGVGVWNAMFVAQLLSPEPLVQVFFLALSMVGSVLAGLGWLLFATTASSTANSLTRREVYAASGVLGGLDIVLAVTSPVHTFYWQIEPFASISPEFAVIVPGLGYWFHTGLLVLLFGAGTALFADSVRNRPGDRYVRAYVVTGTATTLAILGSNAMAPGGLGVAPIVGATLTTAGWLQATRGRPLAWLSALRS